MWGCVVMTTQEQIAIMQAFLDGKIVEYNYIECYSNTWGVVTEPWNWNFEYYNYRVKPESAQGMIENDKN